MILVDLFFFGILLYIAYIDYKTCYIYDVHIGLAFIVALLKRLFFGFEFLDFILGTACGFAIGYVMYKLAYLYYKEEAFGFGDVLLLMVIGSYFGFSKFFPFFSVTYLVLGVLLIPAFIVKPALLHSSIPMAPVYVLGALFFKSIGSPDLIDFLYMVFY